MITTPYGEVRRADLAGWLGAGAIATILAATWWWILFLPLGDSHDGRINGRFGLHVRNLLDRGPLDSSFGASLDPFAETTYAHHPPLINGIHGVLGVVFGRGEWQLHLLGWLAGMATVMLLVGIMRMLGIGWPATLVAMALTAATPMFWIYARLGLGMSLGLLLIVMVLRELRSDSVVASPGLLVATGIAAVSSWPNALLAVVATVWMWRSRRRAAISMAVVGLVGAALVATWILQATNVAELRAHTSARLVSPASVGEFFEQYRFFYTTLFPAWYLWLMVPAVVAGLADRRSRTVVGVLIGVSLVWTVALPEAAFVHDYWTYPLLGPVTIGIAVLVDLAGAGQRWRQVLVGLALTGLAGASFVGLQEGPIPTAYFVDPSEAGRLLSDVGPAPGQRIGYVAGPIALPRWMAYYWDVPVVELDAVATASLPDDYLVLIRSDRLPDWAPLVDGSAVVGQAGRYLLVEAWALQPG